MKITAIELGILRVPLRTPFRTALRTVEHVEDVVVMIRTDSGRTGYGSAAPTAVITGDTRGSIIDAIANAIAPRLIGQPVAALNALVLQVQTALQRNTSAKAAVEIALHDLFAQMHGAPLYRILGGGEVPALHTDLTISTGTPSQMVEASLAAVERGFQALKIKVGKDPAGDFERVRAIHSAIGDRAQLRLDANQGWRPKQAISAMRQLEMAGIHPQLLEQPVPAADLAGLQQINAQVHVPVLADESVFGPRELIDLIQMRAADLVNIKLMKSAGISNAIRLADIAAIHGMHCMIGCMIESSISVAAAAHLAAARPDVITMLDLDAPSLCTHDPVEGGVHFEGAKIHIDDSPGLGIRAIHGLEPLNP